MRAGKLDSKIVIERAVTAPNEYGTPVQTWGPIATVRAEIVTASTDEFIRTYGASDETIVVFRIRYLDGVTNADRVSFGGVPHNIKEVKEIRRRQGLEIRTVTGGST